MLGKRKDGALRCKKLRPRRKKWMQSKDSNHGSQKKWLVHLISIAGEGVWKLTSNIFAVGDRWSPKQENGLAHTVVLVRQV